MIRFTRLAADQLPVVRFNPVVPVCGRYHMMNFEVRQGQISKKSGNEFEIPVVYDS